MHQILARIDRLKASCSLVPSSAPSEVSSNKADAERYEELVEKHYKDCTTGKDLTVLGWVHMYKDDLVDLVNDHLEPLWISKLLILLNLASEEKNYMNIKVTLEEKLENLFKNITLAADAFVEAQDQNNATKAEEANKKQADADQNKLQTLKNYRELLNNYKNLIDEMRKQSYVKDRKLTRLEMEKMREEGRSLTQKLFDDFLHIKNRMIPRVEGDIADVEFLQAENAKRRPQTD